MEIRYIVHPGTGTILDSRECALIGVEDNEPVEDEALVKWATEVMSHGTSVFHDYAELDNWSNSEE